MVAVVAWRQCIAMIRYDMDDRNHQPRLAVWGSVPLLRLFLCWLGGCTQVLQRRFCSVPHMALFRFQLSFGWFRSEISCHVCIYYLCGGLACRGVNGCMDSFIRVFIINGSIDRLFGKGKTWILPNGRSFAKRLEAILWMEALLLAPLALLFETRTPASTALDPTLGGGPNLHGECEVSKKKKEKKTIQ